MRKHLLTSFRLADLNKMFNGMLKDETNQLFLVKSASDADGAPTFPLGPDHVALSTTLPRWMGSTRPHKTWQRTTFARTAGIFQQTSVKIWVVFGIANGVRLGARSIGQKGQRYWESTNAKTGCASRIPRFQHQQLPRVLLKSKDRHQNKRIGAWKIKICWITNVISRFNIIALIFCFMQR